MNRHHPYGGYDGPRRGGGSPQGPGPDRHPRFGRSAMRGGRGRGGATSFYDHSDYDDASGFNSSQNYNVNGAGHEDPFYFQGQGQHMGAPSPTFSSPSGYGAYDNQHQGYGGGAYEDKSQSPSRGQFGQSGRGKRANPRKERDDKIHDSLIEERIQRERPCRTLFIRNIKYETDSGDVRHRFEEHGEIKTFFDLIANRGMVFVTYYDLRAAERARDRLQGSEISGRPIDVHYSLPRGDEQQQECDRDKNQGTLLVTLRNSASGQPIDDTEVRRKFQQFGDVKSVKHVGDRPDQRYVELYDIRACEEAHDRLRHQGLQDGVMDIIFAWDVPDNPLPPGPFPPTKRAELRDRQVSEHEDRPFRGRGGGRGGRGQRGRDGFRDRDPRDRELDDWERDRGSPRDDWGRDRGRRYDDMGPGPSPRSGRFERDNDGYGSSSGPSDDRLEQAKKVQQLLAALKQPAAGTPSQPPPAPHPPAQPPRMPMPPPPMPPSAGPPMNPYYPPPPPSTSMQQSPYMPPPPPPNPYAGYPPPTQQPQSQPQQPQPPQPLQSSSMSSSSSIGTGLSPHLLALLQQAQQQAQQNVQPQGHAQQQHQTTSPMPYNLPQQHQPQSQPASNPPPALQNPHYQQLLAFMQTQQKRT